MLNNAGKQIAQTIKEAKKEGIIDRFICSSISYNFIYSFTIFSAFILLMTVMEEFGNILAAYKDFED